MNRQVSLGRVLLIVGAVFLVLFLGYHFFVAPLQAYNQQINSLQQQVGDKQLEVAKLLKVKQQLQRWREQSLPADPDVARGNYGLYLDNLLRGSGAREISLAQVAGVAQSFRTGPGVSKKPVYLPVNYTADFKISLDNLARLLQHFRQTPLAHKFTSVRIEPVEKLAFQGPVAKGPAAKGPAAKGPAAKGPVGKGPPGKGGPAAAPGSEVRVHLAVEALVIDGADAVQPTLQPQLVGADGHLVELDVLNALTRGPAWLTLLSGATPSRDYVQIAQKNIFLDAREAAALAAAARGGRVLSVAPYVYLTKIIQEGKSLQAFLRDRWNNNKTTLLQDSGEGSSFRVVDSDNKELFKAEVLRIDPRDVYFMVDSGFGRPRVYDLHVGQNLAESLRQPMPNFQVQALELLPPDEGDDGF
jgi:hypothetical protein